MSSPANLRPSIKILILAGIGILSLAALAVHARYYMPFIADDALISLRYARRLLDGLGLTWTDGEIVEGYSNLLWVLLTALTGWLGIDLIKGARILGLGFTSLSVIALLFRQFQRPTTQFFPLASLVGSLLIVLAGPIAVWSIGGLEGPLLIALLSWAVVLSLPFFEQKNLPATFLIPSAFLYGLLCLTRVDGALFTILAVGSLVFHRGLRPSTMRAAIVLGGIPFLFYLGQLIFRLIYYGQWVSNTTLVKVSPSLVHLMEGILYVRDGLWVLAPACFLALLSFAPFLVDKSPQPAGILPLVSIVGWCLYVIGIGGDIFPAWRMLVPIIPLLALQAVDGTAWLEKRITRRLSSRITWLLVSLIIVWYARSQLMDSRNQTARSETWEEYGRVIGLMLKQGFSTARPLLGVEPAGCLPYWSELPSLDLLGLNDAHIARNPPESFGQGWIGHELGDGDYVFSRQPDLLLFCLPWGSDEACYLSGKQMQAQPRFDEMYTLVTFEARRPYKAQSYIFVHRYSPRIGFRAFQDGFILPGYLMNAHPATITYLDSTNQFVVLVNSEISPRIDRLTLPAGKYLIASDPPDPFTVVIKSSLPGSQSEQISLPGYWSNPHGEQVTYQIEISIQGESELRNLLFTQKP